MNTRRRQTRWAGIDVGAGLQAQAHSYTNTHTHTHTRLRDGTSTGGSAERWGMMVMATPAKSRVMCTIVITTASGMMWRRTPLSLPVRHCSFFFVCRVPFGHCWQKTEDVYRERDERKRTTEGKGKGAMLPATAPCSHSTATPDTFARQGSDITRTHVVSTSSFAGCPCHTVLFCVGK